MTEITFPCYHLKQDKNKEWYWIYRSSNALTIARSSESYKNKSDCLNSVNILKKSKDADVFNDVEQVTD